MLRKETEHKKPVSDHQQENNPSPTSSNCFRFYLPWFLADRLSLPGFRNAGNVQP